mmetsp:Transcript_6133/g.13390  ORF Transcript_6133/g.13390 Transcript_6133/m.13390 type:complete len:227 (-) Transcript_6133:470-1150(-)
MIGGVRILESSSRSFCGMREMESLALSPSLSSALPERSAKPTVQKTGDQPSRYNATSAFIIGRIALSGCWEKSASAKISGRTPEFPNAERTDTSCCRFDSLGIRMSFPHTLALNRPIATCTHAASGSAIIEPLIPFATVLATDVDSIDGRKMLYTPLAKALVVFGVRRPSLLAATPIPQQVSSSATDEHADLMTCGSSVGIDMTAMGNFGVARRLRLGEGAPPCLR